MQKKSPILKWEIHYIFVGLQTKLEEAMCELQTSFANPERAKNYLAES